MPFKENLLNKIEINRLVRAVSGMIGPVDSGTRIDRALLEQLMRHFPWIRRKARDLELYLETDGQGPTRILVLDNDLTIYATTVDDVVLRKSPTVKEMVNIKNAIKILNDKDVVLSKKEASLKTIQDICIGELDLHFTAADIDGLAQEGKTSLENGDTEGIQESLKLFAELLGLAPAPRAFAVQHCDMVGKINEKPDGETTFGPLLMFSLAHNSLIWLEAAVSNRDKGRFDRIKAVAAGEAGAAVSGAAVFDLMKTKVMIAAPAPSGD